MHWIDIVLLVLIVVPTFIGLKQGLIKAVLSLAGIIIGVVLASNFYLQLAGMLSFISNPDIANIVAYAIILIVVIIAASLLARLLKTVVKMVMLGWVNHLGGAVFGFLMGAITLGGILAVIVRYFGPNMLAESLIASILLDKVPLVLAFLPSEFDMVKDFFQ
jgi:membrane protein required for colicin V production